MNNFSAIGRIGRDAETRYTQSGKEVTGWPVAIDIGYGDKKSTLWVECVLWGDRGPKLAEYLRKGERVGIVGEISLDTFTNKEGVEKSKVRCNVRDVTLLGSKHDGERQAPARSERPRAAPQPAATADQFDTDDIPF